MSFSMPGTSGYGMSPSVVISHSRIPNDQTSDAEKGEAS